MELSQSSFLALALAFGYEYWLRHWWGESIGSKMAKPICNYLLYRSVHFILLLGSVLLLFVDGSFGGYFAFATCLVIVGSLELVVRLVSRAIERITGLPCYVLSYLVPVTLFFLSFIPNYTPRFDLDYKLVFLFVFLAHPANYFIRHALQRSKYDITDQDTDGKFTSTPEAAATRTEAPFNLGLGDDRARFGRLIGTIERWLIVLLIASNNIASIGLVITAKSIVRYPQLKDQEFAEYYLLGTLLSVVLALAVSFLVLGGGS